MPATGGTKVAGSTAAQNVVIRVLHGSDDAAPTMHNPPPGAAGNMAISDGTKWVVTTLAALAASLSTLMHFDDLLMETGDYLLTEADYFIVI